VIAVPFLIALPFLHAVRRAREWVWWVGGLRFGEVRVSCNLRSGGLIGLYWAVIGLSVVLMMVYGLFASTLVAITMASDLKTEEISVWLLVPYSIGYLALLISLGALSRIFLTQRVWRRVAVACTVTGLETLAEVAAAGDPVSAFGEGLADGLDFGL